jgi:hypothetical protein
MRQLFPTLALIGALGCNGPAQAPGPYLLEVARAAPAVSTPGQQIDTIAVRVVDVQGNPIPGVAVTWQGDGIIEPLEARTDAAGMARARWVLPRWGDNGEFGEVIIGPSGDFAAVPLVAGVESVRIETTARAFTADQVDSFGCGIRAGELWCWSAWEDFGGIPAVVDMPAPHPLREVRASRRMRCVLDAQRLPWCAPRDGAYQRVAGVPALAGMRSPGISGTLAFFCGLAVADQRVWCWPDDPADTRAAWVPLDEPLAGIGVGELHGCGLKLDGSTWCWGQNPFGQFGNGTTTDSDVPVPASGGHRFIQVAVGGWMTCGIKANNEIWCWGRGINSTVLQPERLTVDGAVGPGRLDIGSWGDGYLLAGAAVRSWSEGEPMWWRTAGWDRLPIAEVDVDNWACVRSVTSEVYCSWTLLKTATTTSILAEGLVPVPDPASQVDP